MTSQGNSSVHKPVTLGSMKSIQILFENSVLPHRKYSCVYITKTNWLGILREINAVYCEDHTEHINMQCVCVCETWSILLLNHVIRI